MEIKAGRELDAVIAEKVMGMALDDIFEHEEMGDELGWVPISTVPLETVPHYSTSIADAWLVVEKLKDTCGFSLDYVRGRDKPGRCWFGRAFGQGETAPLAICIAAMDALKVVANEKT